MIPASNEPSGCLRDAEHLQTFGDCREGHIGTASAQAGISFETAFAGVKKTTDATAEEYSRMREEIIGMTREIPATGIEISAVAEAAGQLGIEKENLLAFTRTMVDLGNVANDLSSEEAATALAKFAKKAPAEAKKANLDAYFGKIALSMRELEDVAAYIVRNNSFGQLEEAVSQLGKLDGVSDSINESVSELNRMNWKISIRMRSWQGWEGN